MTHTERPAHASVVTVAPTARVAALARRTHANRVRDAVREQIADSQRRRQQVSQAIATVRRELRDLRHHIRNRRREHSPAPASRRAPGRPAVPLVGAALIAAPPTPDAAITSSAATAERVVTTGDPAEALNRPVSPSSTSPPVLTAPSSSASEVET